MFFYNFLFFVPLVPPVPVTEDRNVMQRHFLYMTSFVTSKVQTTVNVVSFLKNSEKKDIVNIKLPNSDVSSNEFF